MNAATVERWKDQLAVAGAGRKPENPALLTTQELAAFHICAARNLRIEQERIPQAAVIDAVRNR